MDTVVVGVSAISVVAVVGSWLSYFAAIPRDQVPARPVGHVSLQLLGMGLAAAAVVWSYRSGGLGAAVVAPAVLTLLLGAGFLGLLSLRKTPLGRLAVKVGDALLPFEATSSSGAAFHSDTLAGQRTLLKFFRGNW